MYKLCLLGAVDVELADFFQISVPTLHAWRKAYPEFLKSGQKGKLQADAEMASKLYHRGLGYSHPEEKVFCSDGEIVTYETVRHYPPDTAAAFIWLKNRRPDLWRDRQEVTGPDGGPVNNTPPTLVINFFGNKQPGDDAKLIESKTTQG